ncbi:MAG TPA: LURP-one-related family protein [Anaerovoracaceae bacterium]|nr:LURP-one-related family protein [Anaerovoracaceae bacterium]
MSLIGKVVKSVAPYAIADALDIPIKALEKAYQRIEEKSEESTKKLFEKQPGTGILVINQHQFTWKDKLDVYDENREIKYTVKGELASIKHHLHIYDVKGKELGMVKEKLIALRSPISLESNPVDFIIEIGGKKIGIVKSRWAFRKQKYEVDFNGWRIEGNVFGWKYKIFNGNEEIANISQKLLYFGDTYVINFLDPKNEFVVMMLVIALDAANAPKKSEEMRRTSHHKRRPFK